VIPIIFIDFFKFYDKNNGYFLIYSIKMQKNKNFLLKRLEDKNKCRKFAESKTKKSLHINHFKNIFL